MKKICTQMGLFVGVVGLVASLCVAAFAKLSDGPGAGGGYDGHTATQTVHPQSADGPGAGGGYDG